MVLTISPGAGAHTTTEVMTARKAMIERRMVVNEDEGDERSLVFFGGRGEARA